MSKKKIAIIGLGYVGLPLAIEFGKKRDVVGFDINKIRISQLKSGIDSSLEVTKEEITLSAKLNFSDNINDIKACKIFIVTIPTPVDHDNKPDLSLLYNCCKMLGLIIKKDDLVIFESTVYPGVTEEFCVPIIEKYSGLIFNKDFYAGYSPERINPGDKKHRLPNILKITSGSTPEISNKVDKLYKEIIMAGTYKAQSIKVAEAAKVIENTQRDVNIALINEFAMIFNKLNIDTKSVLDAAGTKWNFLPFRPGLVGGHCIGVDPYYLAFKALQVDHDPEIILAGRNINDRMALYVGEQVKKFMIEKNMNILQANILVMGITFKENCPDTRNSKIIDLIKKIKEFCPNVDVHDSWADKNEVKNNYNINLIDKLDKLKEKKYDVIIFAVAHNEFKKMSSIEIRKLVKKNHIIYDLKYLLDSNETNYRL